MADRTLPTGTLTFLFTDLEGSTRLLHEFGDAYAPLLETHRGLIRAAIAARGGLEFGTGGDALFVVFDSAESAVAAATEAQHALASYPWPAGVTLRVRMALHTGEARVVDGDYVGVPLHVVARLCSAGHGGQILVSETTRALAPTPTLESLGMHRLRDVPEPVEIFQVSVDGLDANFPALKTLSARPNNLPAAADRLIGRELEIVEVAEALSERRLVTLVGAGGSGKTRLAVEVAASVLSEFPDGVWFVQLGAATTADQVASLTAQILRIGERGGQPLLTTLWRQLAMRSLLLVIDNCEHLIDAVAHFANELLAQCPDIRVLATSREVLGVRGEHAIAVAPLGEGDAARLFVERARAAVPGFGEGTDGLDAVGEICRRLDGLPLAIELAAARLRGISLRQIADRLDDRFRLLGSSRQRTLAAVVAWSYDLLDEPEKSAFRRLAIFADSFDLPGAEAVAGWGTVDPSDVLDLLTRLVDKSLVLTVRNGGDYRYRLLETLRHYGRDQLNESGERDDCVAQLHGWAATWGRQLETAMRTPLQDEVLADAGHERENLRAVYEQAREAGDDELALRIVTFAPIMLMRERLAAIDALLSTMHDVPTTLHGHALTSCAQFAFAIGRSEDGCRAARQATEIFESIGDRRHAAWARYFEVFSAWGYIGDTEMRTLLKRVRSDFRELDESLGLAYMLWVTSQLEPDVERAEAQAAESEALFRTIGAPFGLAHSLEGRALIYLQRNDSAHAVVCLSESIPIYAGSVELGCLAHALEAVAAVLTQLNERRGAAFLLGGAEELRTKSGHAHRPWELHSRDLAEEMLASDEMEAERERGRAAATDALVARATALLERAHLLEQPT